MVAATLENTIGLTFGRRGKRSAIGLDLGGRSISAVQIERSASGGRPRVVAAVSRERGATDASHGDLADLGTTLSAGGFSGRRVVAAAPGDSLMVGPLELPPRTSGAPLDQLARMEVARNFRCPPDSFELNWWELQNGARGRGTHALAVALAHAPAETLLDALDTKAGLDSVAIDAGPVAAVRACRPLLASGALTAILDLGWSAATLTVVCGQAPAFCRRIAESAGGPLHQRLQKTLGVEPDVVEFLLAEVGLSADESRDVAMPDMGRRVVADHIDALVKELTLSFSYAATQYPDLMVGRMLLIGGGATVAGYAERLAEGLGVETAIATPAQVADCDAALLGICAGPAMMTSLGLALHELA